MDFCLSEYLKQAYPGEAKKGSTVMVLFTVKKVRVWDVICKVAGMPPLKFGIHPTILATAALAELAEW